MSKVTKISKEACPHCKGTGTIRAVHTEERESQLSPALEALVRKYTRPAIEEDKYEYVYEDMEIAGKTRKMVKIIDRATGQAIATSG